MWDRIRGLAFCVALFVPQCAAAQDVTLTAREGGLSVSGQLRSFDGEFYRVDSTYGLLTIDASGVICDGPACPDLLAPKADFRVVGLPGVGDLLLPDLIGAFGRARGLQYEIVTRQDFVARLIDPATGKPLADISFMPADTEEMRAALVEGRAELGLAAEVQTGFGARTVALDAMLPVVAPGNPTPRLSTSDLARALAGEVVNWSDLGGPDMPIVIHGLHADAPLQRALSNRLGRDLSPVVIHDDLASLGASVAEDPWALAVTVRSGAGAARQIPLTDSCGFPLLPTSLAVKAEDYPLSIPYFFLTPKRRLPLLVREFLEFLATPQAQAVIAQAGFIDRQPERQPMTADGLRLINAIQGAGEDTSLADLKRLVGVMDGAERLSLTFRFKDGSSVLDPQSRDNLLDLARLLSAGVLRERSVILAGFSDGSGPASANLDLGSARAEAVLSQLLAAAPELDAAQGPKVMSFGEALPMACDETAAGRRLNRRVEVWLRPSFTDSPATGN